jgi:hypothetical protein
LDGATEDGRVRRVGDRGLEILKRDVVAQPEAVVVEQAGDRGGVLARDFAGEEFGDVLPESRDALQRRHAGQVFAEGFQRPEQRRTCVRPTLVDALVLKF